MRPYLQRVQKTVYIRSAVLRIYNTSCMLEHMFDDDCPVWPTNRRTDMHCLSCNFELLPRMHLHPFGCWFICFLICVRATYIMRYTLLFSWEWCYITISNTPFITTYNYSTHQPWFTSVIFDHISLSDAFSSASIDILPYTCKQFEMWQHVSCASVCKCSPPVYATEEHLYISDEDDSIDDGSNVYCSTDEYEAVDNEESEVESTDEEHPRKRGRHWQEWSIALLFQSPPFFFILHVIFYNHIFNHPCEFTKLFIFRLLHQCYVFHCKGWPR